MDLRRVNQGVSLTGYTEVEVIMATHVSSKLCFANFG